MTAIALREATIDDAELLLAWRNEAAVRESAFESEPISSEAHRNWLRTKLAVPRETKLWILVDGDRPIGQVRFDRTDDETAEVDVSIDVVFRGKGFGSEILRLSAPRACRSLGVRRIEAVIKANNLASIRGFEAAGFARQRDEIRKGVLCALMVRRCSETPEKETA